MQPYCCPAIGLPGTILFPSGTLKQRTVSNPLKVTLYTLKNPYSCTGHPRLACTLRSSPRPISGSQLRALLRSHPCPIHLVVYKGPYPLKGGKPHLEGGFTLRCLQRLSLPGLATLPWHWHANRCTSGPSTPVLSYWGQPLSGFLRPRRIGTELSHDVLNPARVPL